MNRRAVKRGASKWRTPLTLSLVLVATTSVAAAELSFRPYLITMEGIPPYYQPFEAAVPAHMPIQWKNPTASPHSVRDDGCVRGGACLFDSALVPPDGSYTIQGLPPGRYPYHCALHPIMRGELVVGSPERHEVLSVRGSERRPVLEQLRGLARVGTGQPSP